MKWSVRKSLNYDSVKDPIVFQTLDWHCDDYISEKTNFPEYKIFVFGITTDGFPISLRIDDFNPFFYIEVPITWDSTCIYSVKEVINSKVIKKMEFLQRKKYYGFEKNTNRKFIKLSFYSIRGMRSVKYRIEHEKFMISGREHRFNLYESNIDTILRFTHIADILTAGWVQLQDYKDSPGDDFLITSWKSVKSFDNDEYSNKQSDIRVLYYDIEACSADGSFPNANKPNDRVTQICAIIKDSVTKNTEKYLFNVGSIGEIEDTTVLEYSTEKKMLLAYSSFIKDTNPDIIVGYNIFGFDNGYIFERAKILNITDSFNYQSKLSEYYTEIISKTLNNQQSGFNEWKMTRLVGRIHIDLLQVIKKDFKLESYKLDYVGEHFIGQGKDDVSPKEIFEAWSTEDGTKEKRTRVGKYCVQDTNLCLLLFEKFAVLPNHIEMAKVTRVPIEYLITRGQSIKVFSQIAYETRKAGFLIPVLPRNDKESKFQGATVLEAKVGFYKQPVAGLDFASLYPSIMIAHNMCYSTVVLDDKYLDLPGVEYSHLEWESVNDFGENTKFKFSFVQNEKGVLSGILENLWKARKVTKRQMNAEKDLFIKTVLNAKQLAIKVSMNSIYGFTGAVIGALPCLAISQSVTGCGRQMIEQTSSLARSRFNCEIIYGDTDSCYVIFPEPVDSDGSLTTLFKKAEEAAAEISKTFKKPIELEFEKFMYPLILVAKKRYMYVEWTDPKKNNGEIEAKGVELVRRDNCPYVKETLNNVLNPIMFDINISLGRKEAERHIDDLLNGKVQINKLILSKTLRNEYKNPEVIAHYKLVEKMTARDPNSAPKPGDRVPFVYVDIGDPKALSWKKVEDPKYVTENNVPIDYLYYLEHQLMNPLKTIFDILLGEDECKKLFDRKSLKDAKVREKKSIGEAKRIKEGNKDLRSFFKIIIN